MKLELINEIEELKEYIEENGLATKNRAREVVDQRGYLYKHIRTKYGYSFARIGAMFNRDHGTVIHGIREYEYLKGTKEYVNNICVLINKFHIDSDIQYLNKSLSRKNIIVVEIKEEQLEKLTRFRLDNQISKSDDAIKLLIDQILH